MGGDIILLIHILLSINVVRLFLGSRSCRIRVLGGHFTRQQKAATVCTVLPKLFAQLVMQHWFVQFVA